MRETMAQDKSKMRVIAEEPPEGWAKYEGGHVVIQDKETLRLYQGKVRLKAVNCGKPNCRKCPHRIYAYAKFRTGSKVTEKYLGVAR